MSPQPTPILPRCARRVALPDVFRLLWRIALRCQLASTTGQITVSSADR
jgi:hypothetical protein